MGQTVILTATNYASPVSGKNYKMGNFCFNYPVTETAFEITTQDGSNIIQATEGFLDLLPSNGVSNKPIYPFIASVNGMIYEIDYVIDDNYAVLKQVCTTDKVQSGFIYGILLTPDTPLLSHTYLMATGFNPATGVFAYNKYSALTIDISTNMKEDFFSEPFAVDLITGGGPIIIMTLIY